jgi:RimJ/RimL family protein N-acetyltransferase
VNARRASAERGVVRLEPWGRGDLPLLERLLGDPAMMEHLGGPEPAAKIASRQARYEKPGSRMFKIVDQDSGEPAGWVGYWPRTWQRAEVFEIGWSVLPEFQGRGIAGSAAAQAVTAARGERTRRFLHAFPSVDHVASNAICRKLGFELVAECDFEYPPGNVMCSNDWRLELFAAS